MVTLFQEGATFFSKEQHLFIIFHNMRLLQDISKIESHCRHIGVECPCMLWRNKSSGRLTSFK